MTSPASGLTYGATNAPTPGSGGGGDWENGDGGAGGGLVWVRAGGIVTVNGTISANGGNGNAARGGAGSGGGVFIACRNFLGNGAVSANGANFPYNGQSSYSGGGRIAVWLANPDYMDQLLQAGDTTNNRLTVAEFKAAYPAAFSGTVTVTKGTQYFLAPEGEDGTAYFYTPPPRGTVFMFR